MKILIVSATPNESEKIPSKGYQPHVVQVLVTGIGMINTAYRLTKALSSETFDLVLNIGICGSYTRTLSIGNVVQIKKEIFSELGTTDADGRFLDLRKMGFNHFSLNGKEYYNSIDNLNKLSDYFDHDLTALPAVQGLTVNTVNGDNRNISDMNRLFKPEVENMEGSSVAAVCLQEGVPYFEFRCISNYVEPRDTAKWNIPMACSAIQDFTTDLLTHLKCK